MSTTFLRDESITVPREEAPGFGPLSRLQAH